MKQLSILMFFLLITITITAVTNTWDGSSSTVWSTNANWSLGHYPILAEDVVIPITMSGRYPVLTGTYSCNSVTMETGSSLEIGNGTLNITGILTSQGNLKLTNELANLYVQDMAFNSGATMTIPYSGANLYISDDVSFNAGSNINPDYGNFRFSGGSPSITTNVSVSIYTLISNSTNLRHVAGVGNLTIKGNLTVSSSFSYVGLADAETIIYGTVFVGTGGTLQFNAGMVVLKGNNTTLTTRSGNYFNHLFINKTAGYGVTLNSNIDVNGNLTIYYNSSLTAGVYDITLGGNWTNWGGTNGYIAYAADNAFVIFDGAVNQTINDSEFFDWMVLNKSGGYLIIANGVTIECYFYDWTAGSLDVQGSFYINNLNDNAIYGSISIEGYMELHQSSIASVNLMGDVYINAGTFNIYGGTNPAHFTATGMLYMNIGTMSFHNVGITIDDGFSCTFLDGTLRTSGSLVSNSFDFDLTNGTIEMFGNNASSINFAWISEINNLVINKAPGVRVNAITNLYINGNLEVQSGIFTCISYYYLISGKLKVFAASTLEAGSAELRVAGDFIVVSSGTVIADDALLYMNGTSYQFITGNAHFGTFVLNNTGMFIYFNTSIFSCDVYQWYSGHLDFAYSTFTAYDLADPGIYGAFSVHNDSVVNLYQDTNSSINCNGYMRISTNSTVNIYGGNAALQFSGTLSISDGVLDIKNNSLYIAPGLSEYISGGTIRATGNVYINHSTFDATGSTLEMYGNYAKQLNAADGAVLGNLLINKNSSVDVVLFSNLTLSGNLVVQSGDFEQYQELILTVHGNVNIYSKMIIVQDSRLVLLGGTVNVWPNSFFEIFGNPGHLAYVTSGSPGNSFYGFNVMEYATISAQYAVFEYMNVFGINIHPNANVSTVYPFNHCTFRNGTLGGTLMILNSGQDLYMHDVNFPTNTWGGSYNVFKNNGAGSVIFTAYSGGFSGPSYESDPGNRINWSLEIPPVENLTITNAGYTGSIQYVRLDWDYPIAGAQFAIYQSMTSPYANFTVIGTTTSNFAEFAVLASDMKRFYKITVILEP